MEKSEIAEIFKNSKAVMKPLGLRNDDDQVPQLTWIMFLKCIDDFEKRKEMQSNYRPIIPKPWRWRDWATDEVKGLTGQDLFNFITTDLFPTLQRLPAEEGLEERNIVSSIFRNVNNKLTGDAGGYKLRQIVNDLNRIPFTDTNIVRMVSELYEDEIIAMRNSAKNRAVFYTPKAIVQFIVDKIKPDFRRGERVFDPACGMGGFLIESLNYMKKYEKSREDLDKLRYKTLYGIEKEGEYYLCAVMRMLLRDIDKPNLLKDNSLSKDTKMITDKDQYEVIMTNPTYGGDEDKSVKTNLPFSMKGASTELHFLYYVTESLKENGRAAMIVPSGVLFDASKSASEIKKHLLDACNLHTIVRLPETMFSPYNNIATNILFFDKSTPTTEIWYYQMKIREGLQAYGMTNPPTNEDFESVSKWYERKEGNENTWKVKVEDIKEYNLDLKNPHIKEEKIDLSPHELIKQILDDERKTLTLLEDVEKLIKKEIPK